jgi:hypothetical protein
VTSTAGLEGALRQAGMALAALMHLQHRSSAAAAESYLNEPPAEAPEGAPRAAAPARSPPPSPCPPAPACHRAVPRHLALPGPRLPRGSLPSPLLGARTADLHTLTNAAHTHSPQAAARRRACSSWASTT